MGTPIPMWWAIVWACLLISISCVRCEDVLVGEAPVYRPEADFDDRGDFSTTIPNPMDTIPVEGLLTGFQAFMLNTSGCITVHVWRQTTSRYTSPSYYRTTPGYYNRPSNLNSSSLNSPYWTFVGETKECVQADGDNKTVTYKLPSHDYIRVQEGDVIGYTVNGSDPVAYSVNSDCSMEQMSLAPTGTRNLRYIRPARSYSFTDLNQCRNYSLQVTITKKECTRIFATRVPMNISFTSDGPTTDDECWIIATPNKTVSVINLIFRELGLSSYSCLRGFVQINNGDSAPSSSGYIRRLCHRPSSYNRVVSPITSGAVYIHFWRKGGTGGQIRFVLEYSAVIESPCQNITVTETPLFLRSPGYPNTEYQPNTKMCWRLRVAENSTNRVRVRIDGDYDLQTATCRYSYSTCRYSSRTVCKDYIDVRDGESPNSPMLTKWCNSSSQTNFIETSSGQVLTIYFVTDSSIQAKGFEFKAFALNPDTLHCSHYIALYSPEVLESPHYPFEYPNNRDDCWSVKASASNMRILVTVLDSRLEDDIECSKDWVEILDGRNGSAPLLRRWCGGTVPLPLLSSGLSLYVRFVSSSYQGFSGFRLSYKQITTDACTTYYAYSHKQYLNGQIQTTNDAGVRCWIIQAEEGRLRIQWESVDQAMNQGDCENTYVELYDGDSHRAPLIGKYCENKPIPKHGVHVDGSIIYVRWVVASAPAKFRLAYMSLSAKHCHMEFVTDAPVQLSSVDSNMTTPSRSRGGPYYYYTSPRPDRPAPVGPCTKCKYNPNQQTCWVLESDQPNGRLLVRLTFLELQDKDSRGQCKDSLEIHDGRSLTDPLMGLLCGNVSPMNFTSTGNALLITFQSDATTEKRGFRMTVTNTLQSTGCVKLDANSFNSSLENPRSKPTSGERCWTIRSPSDNQPVRVYAQSIELQREEIINFYDGPSNEALLIKKFDYHTKRGAKVVSSASTMTVVLKTGHQTGGQAGQFMLHYSWLFDARCGYKSITKNATSLTTKGYGSQLYPNKAYTCWVLTTQNLQHVIEIHAKKFNLENDGDKCTADYLEIYDGPNKADDTLLHRWCGEKDGVMLAQSSGRSLYVVFSSDALHQFPGFELEVVAIDNPNINNPPIAPIQPEAPHTEKQSAAPILSESNIVVIVVVICAVIVVIVVVVAFARKRASAGRSDGSRVVYTNQPAAGGGDMGAVGGSYGYEEPLPAYSHSETPPISRTSSTGDTTKLV